MPITLRVNEVFPTIQGEASWTGTPAVFVRLQGCPVGCSWCDTKHTWTKGISSQQVSIDDLLRKVDPAPTWAEMDVAAVVSAASSFNARHTVLTGGEPCAQPLLELTTALESLGTVQVETSGTHSVSVSPDTWVTVSPKVGMRGGLSVLPEALFRANEIKMPVESERDVENLLSLVDGAGSGAFIWLQPVSQGDEATDLCIKACMKHNWRLSIQTHKYAGLR